MSSDEKKSAAFEKEKMVEFQHEMGWGGRVVRRGVHLSSSLLILYFIFPDILFEIGAFKMHRAFFLILLFLLFPVPLEIWRLTKETKFFMQRNYEKKCIGAYIWTLLGAMSLCLLTEIGLPEFIAIPIMLCASLGDPLLGETRMIQGMRRRYLYTLAVLMCSFLFFMWLGNIVLAVIAGFITVVAESLNVKVNWGLRKEMLYDLENRNVFLRKIKSLNLADRLFHTDDNLMMQFIPLVFLLILYNTLPQFFPPDAFPFVDWPTDILSRHQLETFFRL